MAKYNPLDSSRNRDHTEYGGGNRSPQRLPDGSSKELTVGEAARVIRQVGIRAADLPAEPRADESIDAQRARAELARRTNDYDKEVDGGQPVS